MVELFDDTEESEYLKTMINYEITMVQRVASFPNYEY